MTLKDKLKYIFKVDTTSSNNIVIYIFGIRIRHLKPGVKESAKQFIQLDCPVTEIPPAVGTLRKIQLANLQMMKIFDKLCKENNLEYWLDFGNLLGAVRHKGFIPWDDDVDVSMMRDDYEKFIELFKFSIPEYKDLYLEFNNNGKNKCFVKILHKKLPNIAVDIFPYDFYYKKLEESEKLSMTKKIRQIIGRKSNKLLYPFFINNPDKMRTRLLKQRDNEILNNNNVNKTSHPAVFYGIDYPHLYDNYFFDYDKIFPLKNIKYEDAEFPCPNDTDFVLKQVFGDYMSLPDACYPRHTNTSGFKGDEEIALNNFIGENNG